MCSPMRIRDNGPLKAAVIGAGAFGRHHATKYRGIEGVELIAIADPSSGSAQELRSQIMACRRSPTGASFWARWIWSACARRP